MGDPIKTEDGQIVMVDSLNRVGSIPAPLIGKAFAEGFRFATPEESHHQYLETTYGEQPIRTLLEGGARAATFGGYDAVARGLGFGEGVAARREFQPALAILGEIPVYAASLGAAGAVSKIGRAAVGAAGLEGATSVGGRVLAGAVGAGAEGGVLGVQQTISNVSLSDHPLGAEAVLSELGSNMLYGAGFGVGAGAGLSGLGALAKGAANTVLARAQVVQQRMTTEAELAAEKAAIGTPG